ncbi:restriction endonuclease subunit S [Aquihabitans sp. G128]|uniref:restriction endonuclease subunit S n=1 Tax=Aquihabitans sp. G128 TaxID=2849779 RepID=UPI001C23CEDB|nr:restriction endonuclease subunit S [Aquihabitans sp. G128]QXC60783.1 restriction endonuclease subunit S [Aquihabitans sp. G128]
MRAAWTTTTLGEIAQIVSGATPKTTVPEYWDGGIPWATPRDLSDLEGATISATPRTLSESGLRSCTASLLPVGSVLLSSRAPIGHVAINTVPMATNQGFKSFIPHPSVVDANFLYWWLKRNRPLLESLGNGATFKELSKRVTAGIPIDLPPIVEQRRIASVLDAASSLRAKRFQALVKFDTLVEAIFFKTFGTPGVNPKGYEVVPMVELVDAHRPITYGILKPGDDVAAGVPYVRVVDMIDHSIDVSRLRRTTPEISQQYKRSLLARDDLVMSIRGHVGRLAIVGDDAVGANITQDTARLAISRANPRYVLECLRTPDLQRWMSGFTKGAAVRGINLTDVKRIPVPLPPRSEQDLFAEQALEAQGQRAAHLASQRKLDVLFASLQQRAFRGEL